jgi:recombination associated protein RdgC
MFKQAILARATGPLNLGALISSAEARVFTPCGPTQPRSFGFVPPRDSEGAIAESIGGQWLVRLREQTKSVPAAAVAKALDERLDAVERETGRRPKGKVKKELKEEVIHELLPKAFAKDRDTLIWIDPRDGLVVVGSGSVKQADAAFALLVEVQPGVNFRLINTAASPGLAMAGWLRDFARFDVSPVNFSIDRECELKQPDSEKAMVRYSRHSLDMEEIGRHIEEGKLPIKLAMTHAGRVSFVLTEAFALKKLQVLDVALEAATKEERADAFEADVAIWTGELRLLIDSLIGVLGGELAPQQA